MKEVFSFFAADNSDYDKDISDGKRTTHSPIIAVYQKTIAGGHPLTPLLQILLSPNQRLSKETRILM